MPYSINCARGDGDCDFCDCFDFTSGACLQDDDTIDTGVFDGFGYISDADPSL